MNKKGFTLIELLAVILIIAVLSTIITPIISKQIKNTKKKSDATQIALLEKAAKDWALENISNNTVTYVMITELQEKGFLEKGDILNSKKEKLHEGCIRIDKSKNEYKFISDKYDCESFNMSTNESKLLDIIDIDSLSKSKIIGSNEYVYQGENPDNYIKFGEEDDLYRIVSIDKKNDSIKIVKLKGQQKQWSNTPLDDAKFGSNLNIYKELAMFFDNFKYKNIIKKNILWNTGSVLADKKELNEIMVSERSSQTRSNIGLLNITDYMQASTNTECTNNKENCFNDNYIAGFDKMWLLNYSSSSNVWKNDNGSLGMVSCDEIGPKMYPTFYVYASMLSFNGGQGTDDDPYEVEINSAEENS